MVTAEICTLCVILDQMMLSLETLHSLYLLLINFRDVDQLARHELGKLCLMRLEAEETHLLRCGKSFCDHAP